MGNAPAGGTKVLTAFMTACPAPTPADLATWMAAHPDHAAALRDLAAAMLELRTTVGAPADDPPTEAEIASEVALALGRPAAVRAAGPTLREVIDGAGLDLPTVAERVGIDVDVVAALEGGLIASPVPSLLVRRLAEIVPFPTRAMRAAIDASRSRPSFALAAKMPAGGAVARRTWDEVVEASDMSDERKAFWRDTE